MHRSGKKTRLSNANVVTASARETTVHVQSRFGGRSNLGGFAWAWDSIVLSHVHIHAVRGHVAVGRAGLAGLGGSAP